MIAKKVAEKQIKQKEIKNMNEYILLVDLTEKKYFYIGEAANAEYYFQKMAKRQQKTGNRCSALINPENTLKEHIKSFTKQGFVSDINIDSY